MNIGKHGGSCGHSCCLRIQGLSVRIGKDSILHDVNLHLHCGQIVALIGPNGAGKSTLLKAVLGEREYDGVISFSVPGQRNRKPVIGYVPQSPTFDPGDPVTVSDLFACCMSRRPAFLGMSKGFRNHILSCLEKVHGEELIDKRIGTLSGGELQRVLLALALDPVPNILILDEPLSGVDVEGMEVLMDMLDELRQEYDLSILMTTHDFTMLPRYADHVVLIDHAVISQGTPEEVLSSEGFRKVFHRKGEL
jgi:zinc transport system ATP-binding protein